jgi:hypothetical protein
MEDGDYWLSCTKFTIGATIKDGVIIKAAPIARKFIGQKDLNLLTWMKAIGGLKVNILPKAPTRENEYTPGG